MPDSLPLCRGVPPTRGSELTKKRRLEGVCGLERASTGGGEAHLPWGAILMADEKEDSPGGKNFVNGEGVNVVGVAV